MQFIMDEFQVDKSDFLSFQVNMLDPSGVNHALGLYCLTDAIKLEPTSMIPSFYMVNKYGEVYSDAQFILVPYIRFIIADPAEDYQVNVDGITQINYTKNALHPYWIGGTTYTQVLSGQPNKNALTNLKQLFDPYLLDTTDTGWHTNYSAHGIRNENTRIPRLGGIGENLVPNEGTLKTGMFMPTGAQYLQARTAAMWPTATTNHFLANMYTAGQTFVSNVYRYYLSLPEVSTSATTPYILPPLFTDLFSWFNDKISSTASPYDKTSWCRNAIAVLTFGVKAI